GKPGEPANLAGHGRQAPNGDHPKGRPRLPRFRHVRPYDGGVARELRHGRIVRPAARAASRDFLADGEPHEGGMNGGGMNGGVGRLLAAAGLSCVALATLPGTVRADDKSHVTILEENDSIYFNTDKHYTQGLRLSYLGPDVQRDSFWSGAFGLFGWAAPSVMDGASDQSRHYALEFGQSLYTPENK